MSRNRTVESVWFWSFLSILIALFTVGASAQAPSPTLPTKELKLDAKGLERVASAKTVAVIARALPLITKEQTLGPSALSSGKVRLRDTLAVFPIGGPGVAPPLWVGIDTENALAAASGVTTPDAEGVVEKFRRDVENAKSRVKK